MAGYWRGLCPAVDCDRLMMMMMMMMSWKGITTLLQARGLISLIHNNILKENILIYH
jgi:hypothetical protein